MSLKVTLSPQAIGEPASPSWRSFSHGQTSLAPSVAATVQDLHTKLLRSIVVTMLKLGIPFHILLNLSLWENVWVEHRYPPLTYTIHTVTSLLITVLGIFFVWRGRARSALAVMIILSVLTVYLQTPLMRDTAAFGSIVLVLAVPSIVLPGRTMLLLLTAITLGYVGVIQINPLLHGSPWQVVVVSVWSILCVFMIVGRSIRRVITDFTVTLAARQEEAVERARLEEHTRVLQEHHNRLMYAQHDLRGPCNTMLGAIDVLQTPNLTPSIAQRLLKQIEPVVLQLRSRLDSLFDEAKAPLLETRHDLPLLDLACVVAEHQAELQRLTAVTTAEERPSPPTVSVHVSPGRPRPIQARKGEIHRILENLVFNSIAAGADSIAITVREGENWSVELVVEDTGKGFPRWLLEQPLRPTYSQTEKGSGLGLAGVAANVRAFHGTIALENTPGACVRMRFPLADEKKAGQE